MLGHTYRSFIHSNTGDSFIQVTGAVPDAGSVEKEFWTLRMGGGAPEGKPETCRSLGRPAHYGL